MAIVYKDDSDRFTHQIWAQEQAASCAVASIWMARNLARQMTFAEDEWSLAWNIYSQVVQQMPLMPAPGAVCFDPRAYRNDQNSMGDMFSRFGTYMSQVAQKLNNDGLKTSVTSGPTVIKSRLADDKPAIVLLGWYNGTTRNGGHFIVASRVTRAGTIVYLDPWEGKLVEMGAGPNYQQTGRFEQICYISA